MLKKKYQNYNDLYEYRTTFKIIDKSFPTPKPNNEYWDLNPITPKGEGWQLVNSQTVIQDGQLLRLFDWERPVLSKRKITRDNSKDTHYEDDTIPANVSNKNAPFISRY